jgi:hypothetical protein
LQRTFGNRYVQCVVALARQENADRSVSPTIEAAIERSRAGGQPLDRDTRHQMESAFGADFSGVRIHTGAESHALNRAANAVAFTTGRDIFFRDGAYNAATSAGRELLAHELTHVLRQRGNSQQSKMVLGPPGDSYEQDAEHIAKAVTSSLENTSVSSNEQATGSAPLRRRCDCAARSGANEECEGCRKNRIEATLGTDKPVVHRAPCDFDSSTRFSAKSAATIQRVHLDPSGRKAFDCPEFAGDVKLEACLNDEDRLAPNSTGPTVVAVQKALIRDGMDLGTDGTSGVYGAATGQAVMAFKAKHQLGFERFPDVGPGTMAKLDELCPKPPGPKPNPTPKPPGTGKCFDTIDWDTFFAQARDACETERGTEKLVCEQFSNDCSQFDDPLFVENCVVNSGFEMLVVECGIPSQPPGKAEIRKRFRDFDKSR